MSKYAEVYSNYYDDIEDVLTVDARKTDRDDDKTIAKIHLDTREVEYIDPDAKYDDYAQEVIQEVLAEGYSLTE